MQARKATRLTALQPDRQYTAVIVDRIGPFGIQVPVRIDILSSEPRRIEATLTGEDAHGQPRLRGTLEAAVEPKGHGSEVQIGVRIEVLGRLAALGAVPMRRRAEEIFSEFARRLRQELSPPGSVPAVCVVPGRG